jgi:type I restriction enzyme, R subunit
MRSGARASMRRSAFSRERSSTEPTLVERYRQDLKFFLKLRASAAQRYAEEVNFQQYAGPIQKLLDTYVGAEDVQIVVKPVDIFQRDAFKEEVARFESPEAKAEVIANRLRHTIHEHLEEDPVFYRRLSEMLEETYERYERERFEQLELLRRVEEILERAQSRERDEPVPPALVGRDLARTYYDLIEDVLGATDTRVPENDTAALAVSIDNVIERNKIVHWEQNIDVQNRMRTEIEDELFRFKEDRQVPLTFDAMDRLMDSCIEVARRRSART